jgi:hypothetical protein
METIGTLLERYTLSKSQLYARIKHLGIELAQLDDGRTYLTEEQVKRLDRLHDWLKDGDKKRFMREYSEPQEVEIMSDVSIPTENKYGVQRNLFEDYGNSFIKKMQEAIVTPEERAVVGTDILLKYVDNQCPLTTDQVQAQIKIKPTGKVFERYPFTFIRQKKVGRQFTWLVTRTKLKLVGLDDEA